MYRLFRRFSNCIYRQTLKLGYGVAFHLPFYIVKHRDEYGNIDKYAWLIERGWFFSFFQYTDDMSLFFLFRWVLKLGPISITHVTPLMSGKKKVNYE